MNSVFAHVLDYSFGNYIGKRKPSVHQDTLHSCGDALVLSDNAAQNFTPPCALGWKAICVAANDASAAPDVAGFVGHDLWQVDTAFRQLGMMDEAHRAIAEHRLAGCAGARRANAS